VSEAATSTAHAGKAAAKEAGFSNLGQAVSTAVHEAQGKTGTQSGTANTSTATSTPSSTAKTSPTNMGQAVSAAAHAAKAEAKAAGTQVGPAVSAAVHEAQQAARDREAEQEDHESGAVSQGPGRTSSSGKGSAGRAGSPTQP